MKITFGGFFRITPATIMRCGPTFRLARTHPTHARSSGLETSLRSRSLADYTIDTHESEFSEATGAWDRGLALLETLPCPHPITFIPNSAFSVPPHAFVAGYEWRWRVLSSRGSAQL